MNLTSVVDNGVMTGRGGKRWWWVVGLLSVGLATVALGRFLAGQHLDRADKWASVIGMFAGIAGLTVAAYGVVQSRRTSPSAPVETARNTITGGDVRGPALLVRDAQRVSLTGTPITPDADRAVPDGPPPPNGSPGAVENRVEGGTFHGPLIMGRDLRDVVLPPPSRPSPPSTDQDAGGTAR